MANSFDVVVVGGGVVGLAIAWRARRRGLSVVVLERDRVGAGASGVAAGMLAPVTEADFGEDRAIALNLAGLERWPAFAAELGERSGVDTGYRRSGALVVAVDRDDAESLRRLARLHGSLGLSARTLSGREARRLEPGLSPRVTAAIEAPQEGHVDPGAVVAGLRAAVEAEGGELREGAAVEEVRLASGAARVDGVVLADGSALAAGHVVLAGGAWSTRIGGLPPGEAPPVRPVKGQILSLGSAAGEPLAERLIRTPRCYVVSRPDGRVAVGATTEERGFDVRVTAEGVHHLLEAAREVLPDVGELEFVSARAGLRPGTPDNAPAVGRGELDGLLWATGHGRNGVLLAPITGEAVTALVCDEEPPEELGSFGPARFGGRALAAAAGR